eukprot:GCRY01000548.1.p1 GENE.GCRY01000548.1~~GCRY01000548.1.p1  ORF type:complete len:376 (+),score=68.58 GCRY01000548.1:171-1298(+)
MFTYTISEKDVEPLLALFQGKIESLFEQPLQDKVLPQYILVLCRNQKSKEQIQTDLTDFLGTENAETFVNWLEDALETYYNPKSSENMETEPQESKVAPSKSTRNTAFDEKLSGPLRIQRAHERSSPYSSPKAEASLTLDSALPTSRDFKKGGGHFNPNTREFKPKKSVFDRLNKKTENDNEEEEEEVVFDNTNTAMRPARCRFWPNCSNPDCPYVHPTRTCRLFPNCPHGKNCLYIHPAIECRFGAKCTNPKCNFIHPHPVRLSQKALSGGSQVPCKFGANCIKRPHCPFSHPPACRFGAKCTNKTCTFTHPRQTLCKFGRNCSHPDTCPYKHLEAFPKPLPEVSTRTEAVGMETETESPAPTPTPAVAPPTIQ